MSAKRRARSKHSDDPLPAQDAYRVRGGKRRDMGLTAEAFARMLGVSLRTVFRWESGLFVPSKATWAKIRRHLQ